MVCEVKLIRDLNTRRRAHYFLLSVPIPYSCGREGSGRQRMPGELPPEMAAPSVSRTNGKRSRRQPDLYLIVSLRTYGNVWTYPADKRHSLKKIPSTSKISCEILEASNLGWPTLNLNSNMAVLTSKPLCWSGHAISYHGRISYGRWYDI